MALDVNAINLGFLTDTVYYGNTVWQYVVFSLIFIASFLAGKIVYYILKHKVQKIAAKTDTKFDDMILKVLQGPLVLTLVIIGLMVGLDVLTIPEDVALFLDSVLSIVISLVVIWFIIRFVDVMIDGYMQPYTEKSESKLDDQLVPILKKAVKALILIFGVVSIISNFGYDITALITGMGIGGIAIALAAQETLGNMFGGFTIFTDRPFHIGDRVKVGDVYGDVIDVGLRSSKIKNMDNNIVIFPNSILSKSVVENYLRPTHKIKKSFNIGITYGTSPEKVEKAIDIIKKAIASTEGVANDDPLAWLMEFGDFSMNILAVYWIKALKYGGTSKHAINMKILKDFDKAGIEMAFPTQTIHLEK